MEEKKTDKMEQPLFTRPEGGEEDELTIDWMALIRRILAIRRKLYLAAAVGLVAGVIIALSIPKQYTVSVTLSPEMGSGKSGGGLASMAASFLGGGGSDSPDALNATLAPDIVASTPFLLELFDARVRTANGKVDTTLVAYLDEQSAPWWNTVLGLPGMAVGGIKSLFSPAKEEPLTDTDSPAGGSIELSEKEAGKLKSLRQSVLADVDKKTSITTLTVTLQDPKVTATVADSVVSKLQQYITAYRTRKAKEDCRYLEQLYRERQAEYYEAQQRYANYVDANSNVVFQSTLAERERLQNDMSLAYQVYSQVAQQLQVARAKVQEEKPVFAVVEPAVVPREPSGTSRKVIVLGWIFLAVAGVAAWELLGKDYWQKFRSALS
ncbi:chain-length determining protein [Phocaeicola coprophilus]|uniref:Chain length determinant protein n=1 Tax=Phocaeicola coprophilus DSM 18228 = JCM 13818 TaxID=547042 RepID=S0FES9_9BACT|nr:chain-length determining protein [Phocaeicola coprophilus]EEF78181.1 chain length determinant protein [Phocaeicola coprophilus DSM 18228 = JCM 13818]QRO23404.1 chain-length determining protein [Phocaeicola coprophilus]